MNNTKLIRTLAALCVLFLIFGMAAVARAWTPVSVQDDPLVRMPGTQPEQGVAIEGSGTCLFCHSGYNANIEPGSNWQGSMMAQSARDFLFWADLTVVLQDSIWATGRPNAGDICLRCHFTRGWVAGRSDPVNASLMTGQDYDGLQCDFCHRMVDPFFADTYAGQRDTGDWLNDWDETNQSGSPSQAAADSTLDVDRVLAADILRFDGGPFYQDDQPFSPAYTENGAGQYFVSPDGFLKRASFADVNPRNHSSLYSRYHKSKYFCNTCHDVSNPVLANLNADPTQPLPTESDSPFSYFHVERTFSEFMLSAFGQPGGALGIGPYDPQTFNTSSSENRIQTCQDCHMRDVVGKAARQPFVLQRPNQSVEHPMSGLPLHDLTGGNAWVTTILASALIDSPNYDTTNAALLGQGPTVLTLDMTQGDSLSATALLAGAERALEQLQNAAALENISYDPITGELQLRIQNQTGHKLITGFPEGRRMFLNVRAFDDAGNLAYEVNPYDYTAGTLKGLEAHFSPNSPPLGQNEVHLDALVYEMKPSSELTGEEKSFHFALATGRYKDNRIPPMGFLIDQAQARLAEPIYKGQAALDLYTAAEYAGGFDEVLVTLPSGLSSIEVNLYYQTTSREYLEFLRDEINGVATTLSSPTPSGEPEAYIIQTDPFFNQLRAWGDTVWALWEHNKNLPGGAPVLMAQALAGPPPQDCTAPAPILFSAAAGNGQIVLTWSDEHSAVPAVSGYRVYLVAGSQPAVLAETGLETVFTHSGLTPGATYCYQVTSFSGPGCESNSSNQICTTLPVGETVMRAAGLETGKYVNGVFTPTTAFNPGDAVVARLIVVDASGNPLAGAVATLEITGPTGASLTTGSSDANGLAEATWQTEAPRGRGRFATAGTPTGQYSVTLTGITLTGYTWDGVPLSVSFTLQ